MWHIKILLNIIHSNRSVEPINSNRLSHNDSEQKTKNRFISVSCTKNGPGILLTKS